MEVRTLVPYRLPPNEDEDETIHPAPLLDWLDRWLPRISKVLGVAFVLCMFVIAFAPWTLFWVLDKLSP